MSHELEQLRDTALTEIAAAADEQTLEAARVRYLGRAGSISAWAERMKSLSKDEKPVVGKLLNEARTAVTAAIAAAAENLRAVKEARDGDIVILAGKGHEAYQVLKDRTIPFDDREVAREVLEGYGYHKAE